MKMNNAAIREYRAYIAIELEDIAIEEAEADALARAEMEEAERAINDRLWEYLRELELQVDAGVPGARDLYSDVYKDLYGVRPH